MSGYFHIRKETKLMTIAEQHPDENKHDDKAQTSSPQFLCAVSSDQRAKEIIHEIDF